MTKLSRTEGYELAGLQTHSYVLFRNRKEQYFKAHMRLMKLGFSTLEGNWAQFIYDNL